MGAMEPGGPPALGEPSSAGHKTASDMLFFWTPIGC